MSELHKRAPNYYSDSCLFISFLQINVHGWCNSTTDHILVDTSGTNIEIEREGPCLILSGNDTITHYTSVLLSARYIIIHHTSHVIVM